MNEPIFIARQDTLEQEILPAHWLSQYKLFGEESYTFQDKEIWKRLCMSRAAANDRDMHAEALEEMLTTFSAEHTGKWMLTVYGMDAAVLEGLATMAAVAGNGTAMAAVAGNALLMHAITNSETAMRAIANSQTAMQRVANSATAMDAISGSKIARGAVQASPYYNSYIKENDMAIAKLVVGFANLESARYSGCAGMAADSTAMTAVAASSTAMTAVAASSTAMTAVAASATAMGKIAAVDAALSKLAASTTAMDALYARKKQMKGGSASKSGKFIILEISQSNAFNTSKYGYATLSDGSKPDWSSYLAKYAFFQKYPKYATYMLNDTDSDDYIYYFDIASP
ncbi:MAG: hypothetical protein ACLUPD_05585 [Anaerotignum faecicola]